jgi:predicted nuclease with RNAse H fold
LLPQEFRTAGVDLAAQDNRTALAEVFWGESGAVLESVRLGVDNDAIVAAAQRVRVVGIDCPIGWPAAFTDLLIAARGDVVRPDAGADDDARRPLAYRLTDHVVRATAGRWPLSVSADRIAYPAMRCAGLLARIAATGAPVRRDGASSRVAEVYPAAALRVWQLPTPGYKTDPAARAGLVKALGTQASWLNWGGHQQACVDSDDVLDAVVCALVAGAVAAGRTGAPTSDQQVLAREEGWIHLPDPDFLAVSYS